MKRIILSVGVLWFTVGGAFAQTTNFTWAGAVNGLWSQAANWFVDVPTSGTANPENFGPGSSPILSGTNDVVIFQSDLANGQNAIDLQANSRQVQGIQFNAAAGSSGFTINSSNLRLGASTFGVKVGPGGIVNNDANTQVFNTQITLTGSKGGALKAGQTVSINAAAGGITLSGSYSNASATASTVKLNGGILQLTGNNDIIIGSATTAGIISGNGGITKDGLNNALLLGTAANTYTGPTTVNSGLLAVGKVNGLGAGTGPLIVNGGTLDHANFDQTVGAVTMNGGTITGTGGTLTGTSYDARSGTFNGILGGPAVFTKSTAGTVTLSRANTYGGPTTINGGTLRLKNTSGSATSTGNVNVNSGGKLTGDGSARGAVIVNAGGVLAPGDGAPGTLHLGSDLTLAAGSTTTFYINSASGEAGGTVGWGLGIVAGDLTLEGKAGAPIVIDLTSLTLGDAPGSVSDFDNTSSYDWLFYQASTITGFTDGSFVVDQGNFGPDLNGGTFSVQSNGANLDLVFTPVPEPSTIALGLLGGFGLMAKFGFRRNRK